MTMNDTDRASALARLPKWARREIDDLQRQLAEARRHIEQLNGESMAELLAADGFRFSRLDGSGDTCVDPAPRLSDGR